MTFVVWYLAAVGALYLVVAVILMLRASPRLCMALALAIVAAALTVGLWVAPWFWKLLIASLVTGAAVDLVTARRARRGRLPEPVPRAPRSVTASL
ncbi:MAG TPA: hypothetical protein VNU73_04680 [Steroidobacteraceae bacterium]|jgi:hypothetical protein|nr:hypothetical protein [Steroidobacteraceae bacterium]